MSVEPSEAHCGPQFPVPRPLLACDAQGFEIKVLSCVAVANQMDQRPEADPCQEWVTRDPDDALRRLSDAPLLRDEVGLGVVKPMTTSSEAGSISMMAIGFHHSSIPQAPRYGARA